MLCRANPQPFRRERTCLPVSLGCNRQPAICLRDALIRIFPLAILVMGCGQPPGTHNAARINPATYNPANDPPNATRRAAESLGEGTTKGGGSLAESAGAIPSPTGIRFATFNVSLYGEEAGGVVAELEGGESARARHVAEVIQIVRPDVLLLNEIDYDVDGRSVELFCRQYLNRSQNNQEPLDYPYRFVAPVNTGVATEMDLNMNGKTGEAADCFGFGRFPGQYGMAVLSRLPIQRRHVRTFQKFLWSEMPGASRPQSASQPYFDESIFNRLRLSSKSHWDVPIETNERIVHFLVCHPTPPVFDGPEDRNGCRNHDEIRLWADYIEGAEYLVDDNGGRGGLEDGERFVIAGDLNADPFDGDSAANAIHQLIDHSKVNTNSPPASLGAAEASQLSGGVNIDHRGPSKLDTADFADDSTGNLRIDYVLPSQTLTITNSGVFWPVQDDPFRHLSHASDHHLVWVDVQIGSP